MRFSRVRGTQDFLEVKLRTFLISQFRKHIEKYNFSEIETPILEPTSLFIHSLGEQTDVVTKEMYVFKTSGGESICLRPEATAGTMRAFLENHVEKKPWKVWSHGPMFRHERPQKGRWRQFSQINIEVIDTESIAQDAYFIKILDVLFRDVFYLENYVLKLNFLGCSKDRKKHRELLADYLDTVKGSMCKTCLVRKEKNILRVFDCKEESCQALYRDAPKLTDVLCLHCSDEWLQLQELLQILAINFIHTPLLVRGLDYYQKTVFEFVCRELGAQNSFCGGGRYELGKELGAKYEYPSIGAAIGIGRLLMLLESVKDKFVLPQELALYLILPMAVEQQKLALLLADLMQANNLCTDVLLERGSMKAMMRKANKMGASYVIIIGEQEQKDSTVSIKNMLSGDSKVIKQSDMISFLKK